MTLPITVRSEGHRRLLVLAQFLRDNVDEDHYNHQHWICAIEPVDENDAIDIVERRKAPVPVVCCWVGLHDQGIPTGWVEYGISN
jgi:hypothetical protein